MATNLGVAEGYLELDFSELKRACTGAVQELQKIDREGNLAQSELRKLEAASSGVSSSFKGFKGTFQEAANASKKLSLEIQSAEQKIKVYQQSIQKLNDHISQSKQALIGIKQEHEKVTAQQERSKKKVESMSEAYSKAQKEIRAVTKEYGENSQEAKAVAEKNKDIIDSYQKATKKVQEHTNTLNQLEEQQGMLKRSIEESENRIIEFKTQINYTEAEISELSTKLREAQNKAKLFGAAAQEVGAEWKAAGEKISRVGNELTTKITAPLLAAGTASVKMAMDAESSFAKVSTIADETVLSYDKMKKEVVAASNDSGIAIVDFNDALYQSISAGVDSGNAIAFTTDMIKLAKGGFTETTKAVDVVTTALNAYGLEATEAMNISDKLILTQNLGKTTVDELSSSLGRVIPTAKNANVNFDNVAASMAVLTKNGIATSEATTYYNAMLNELSKSGTAADKALRKLTKKGFAELMASGVSMTDILAMLQDYAKKSGKSLADMFGSAEASKAALTIMKNDGQEYNEILKQMEQSAGATEKAYQKMNDTDLEKFKRELNKVKNAGIQAGTKLLPIVTKGVEGIGKLADSFSKLSPKQQEAILKTAGFAAAAGPVVKTVGTLTSGIGSATQGIGKLAEKLGKTGNIDKAAKSLGGVTSMLGAIPGPAKIAVGAIAAIGVGVYVFKQLEEAAVKANLEEHFGSITLSAEELEDVAKRLTTTDWTITLDAYIDAKQTLEEYQSTLESTVTELNKARWKVDIGLELSQEEKDSYKQSLLDFAAQTQDYVSQQHYTSSIAVDAVFTPGTKLHQNYQEFADAYYTELDTDLAKLGSEFAELVNKAWEDGVLSAEEIELLDEKQAEIQAKLDEISQARYDLALDNIQADALEGGLTADSFKQLLKETTKQLDERKKDIEDSTIELLVPWQAKFNKGEIDEKGLNLVKRQIDLEAQTRLGEVTLEAVNVGVGTIKTNYSEELEKASKTFYTDLNQAFEDNIGSLDLNQSWVLTLDGIESSFLQQFDGMDDKSQKAIQEMLKNMEPQASDLAKLVADYKEKGKMIPQGFSQGLLDTYELEMMAGNTNHMYQVLGAQMGTSDEFLEMYQKSVDSGQYVPEGIAEGIYLATGKVYDAENDVWLQCTAATDEALPEILDYLNQEGMKPGDALADSITAGTGAIYDEATGQWMAIQSAALDSEESVKETLTSCGISASDALIQAIMSKEPEARSQTISLLSQLNSGVALSQDDLKTLFGNLGYDVSGKLLTALEGQEPAAQAQMVDLLMQFQKATDEEKPGLLEKMKEFGIALNDEAGDGLTENELELSEVKAPTQSDKDQAKKQAQSLWSAAAAVFRNPLRLSIQTAASAAIPRYAAGGIVDQPQVALIGEAGPESVIPLSISQRSNAVSLWEETGERLGVLSNASDVVSSISSSYQIAKQMNKKNSLEVPVTVGIDYQKLSAAIYEQFKKNPIVLEPDINVTTNPTFFVGSREIAVEIAPEVDAQLGRINKQRARGG